MGNTVDTETETFYAPTVDKSTSVLNIPEAFTYEDEEGLF